MNYSYHHPAGSGLSALPGLPAGSGSTEPSQPALCRLAELANTSVALVADCQERINGVLNRAFGEHPQEKATNAQLRPVRSGAVGSLTDTLDNLNISLAALLEQATRLGTLV